MRVHFAGFERATEHAFCECALGDQKHLPPVKPSHVVFYLRQLEKHARDLCRSIFEYDSAALTPSQKLSFDKRWLPCTATEELSKHCVSCLIRATLDLIFILLIYNEFPLAFSAIQKIFTVATNFVLQYLFACSFHSFVRSSQSFTFFGS